MKTRRKKGYWRRFLLTLTKTSMVICLFLCVLLANAGDWPENPKPVSSLPGEGHMRCQSDFITPDGAYLFQSYWRDDNRRCQVLYSNLSYHVRGLVCR